jgi:hypothetical protein
MLRAMAPRHPVQRVPRALALGLAAAWTAAADAAPAAEVKNGFTLDASGVEAAEIIAGGPPRDGIPALDHPPHVPAEEAGWPGDEIVLGVAWGGEARAYPVAILEWHELVNDDLGGRPILVSYCALCGTGIVFDRRVAGSARGFGVSGLLYRSDLLLYDRETESLWSQISARALTGPSRGLRLAVVRSRIVSWERWRREHPQTGVLSGETGHDRDYGNSPYGDYAHSEELLFPVAQDRRFHPKMPTLGLRLPDGPARGYPASELVRAGGRVEESFAGQRVAVAYDPDAQVFDVEAPEAVEVIEGFWFAWAAFHPEASVFGAPAP